MEMDRVFTRSRVSVAHESEIPDAGGYVPRYVGQDACLARRDDGEVSALLNARTIGA